MFCVQCIKIFIFFVVLIFYLDIYSFFCFVLLFMFQCSIIFFLWSSDYKRNTNMYMNWAYYQKIKYKKNSETFNAWKYENIKWNKKHEQQQQHVNILHFKKLQLFVYMKYLDYLSVSYIFPLSLVFLLIFYTLSFKHFSISSVFKKKLKKFEKKKTNSL